MELKKKQTGRILTNLEKLLHTKYEISSTIKHKGEKGRQRENGLAQFLRENLPEAYGVATGEIITFVDDSISPQCDVIIYDRLRMPIFGKLDAVQQIPIEGVYAIIETKSVLDTNALNDAARKFNKIRALPKGDPRIPLEEGKERGPHFFLFGYKMDTSPGSCTKFIQENHHNQDLMVVSLDHGCSLWVVDEKNASIVWLRATSEERSFYHTLAFFFVTLLESLREIDLGNPSFKDML